MGCTEKAGTVLSDPKKRLEYLLDSLLLVNGDIGDLVIDRGFYECYALSLTHPKIKDKFRKFYNHFRTSLAKKLSMLKEAGVIKTSDVDLASGLHFTRELSLKRVAIK